MRLAAATGVLFALKALASPVESGTDGFGDLTFIGPVVVGGPNVSLSGTAESIYHQVVGLNPAYDAWDFPAYVAAMEARGVSREQYDPDASFLFNETTTVATWNLTTATNGPKPAATNGTTTGTATGTTTDEHGTYDCNKGRKSVRKGRKKCSEGFEYLKKLGSATCGAGAWMRVRVSCSNKCGMFYHNLRSERHGRPCIDIANDLERVFNQCVTGVSDAGGTADVKGRLTSPDELDYVEIQKSNC